MFKTQLWVEILAILEILLQIFPMHHSMHVTNSMTRNHKNDPGTWIFPCHFYEKQDWKLLLKIILMKTDKLVDIIIFIMLNKELRSILGMKITSAGLQFVGNKKKWSNIYNFLCEGFWPASWPQPVLLFG